MESLDLLQAEETVCPASELRLAARLSMVGSASMSTRAPHSHATATLTIKPSSRKIRTANRRRLTSQR